jgi:hypothetical protein
MDAAKLRGWWFHRQGLDGTLADQPPAHVLEQTGWARSLGSSGPYLGFRARCGAGREAIDQAVARLEIHELPSARGCTYVVPASAFPLALKMSQGFGFEPDMKLARKLGVTDAEVDKLCKAVVDALKKGPMDPDALRTATGTASRSLGDEGKKKGMTTTLPLALGRLQSLGEIRRIPVNGRLDQQRFRYTLWRPNPLQTFRLSTEEATIELARMFFTWFAPATFADLQAFLGLGVKASKAAVEPLKLEPLAPGDDRLFLPGQRQEFERFRVPKEPCYAMVSSIDGMVLPRRDVQALVAPEDSKKKIPGEKGVVEIGGIKDLLPSHPILDRGRLIGLWEYDPEAEEIAWTSFVRPTPALREEVRNLEEMIRQDLGDVRAFSLDSPKSRVGRLQALREGVSRGGAEKTVRG